MNGYTIMNEYELMTREERQERRTRNQALTFAETTPVGRLIQRHYGMPGVMQWMNLPQEYKNKAAEDIENWEAEEADAADLADTRECAR